MVGDSSIIFSPPSIVAETLHGDAVFESKNSSVGHCNSKFQVTGHQCLCGKPVTPDCNFLRLISQGTYRDAIDWSLPRDG